MIRETSKLISNAKMTHLIWERPKLQEYNEVLVPPREMATNSYNIFLGWSKKNTLTS